MAATTAGPAEEKQQLQQLGDFKVLTWNVWFEPFECLRRWEALLSNALAQDPDIISFQEVTEDCYNLVQQHPAIQAGYASAEGGMGPTWYDVSIWVKKGHTIQRTEVIPLVSNQGRRCLKVELLLASGVPLRVATVHLESTKPEMTARRRQLERILPRLADEGGADAAILCGDFNFCSTWTEENRTLEEAKERVTDVWAALRPGEAGYTEDTRRNQMLYASKLKTKRVRFDRVLLIETNDRSRASGMPPLVPVWIELLGTEPLGGGGEVYCSDHFGVVATFDVRE